MKITLNRKFKCSFCDDFHKVDIKEIKYGKIDHIEKFIENITQRKIKILILCDYITWEIAGDKINKFIKPGSTVPLILSPKNEKRVIAKYKYVREIEKNINSADLIITVGTGSITDLGKLAGYKYKIPVLSFPTAPSMNGFTSPVSAYIKDGVKITIPVFPCKYVYIDKDIISNAPIELIKAGFADSLAKSFANADWKISSIITGEKFCILPLKIVNEAEKKYISKGDLLLKRDKKVIKNLMDGLNLGGISMIIAGSSSPASGGEHLISHFLDMYSCMRNIEPFAYHGLQVGTGVYISSLIYENLKKIDNYEIEKRLNKNKVDYEEKLRELTFIFPKSKKILEKVFKKKLLVLDELRNKLPEKWDEIKKEAFSIVYSPDEIKKFLKSANCPVHLKEICDDEKLVYNSLFLSRFIRERLTILDIADEIGILKEIVSDYIKNE